MLTHDEVQQKFDAEGAVRLGKSATAGTLFVVLGSLYLGTFLVALDSTIISTALPAITVEFHALEDLAWYGSSYLLTFTALQPTCGKLYKVIDTKLMYLISIAIFEGKTCRQTVMMCTDCVVAGSISCATAPSSLAFILGRAAAGCGAAGLMQGAFAIVVQIVPLSRRSFYISGYLWASLASALVSDLFSVVRSLIEGSGDGAFGCKLLPLQH